MCVRFQFFKLVRYIKYWNESALGNIVHLAQYLVSRDAITFKPVRRRECAPPTRGTGAGRAGRGGGAAAAPAGAESGGGPGSARRPQLTGAVSGDPP